MFFASFWLLYYLFISVALIVGLHADIVLIMMYYTVLTTFYRGTIESILTSSLSVWFSSCTYGGWEVYPKSGKDSRENHQDLYCLYRNYIWHTALVEPPQIISDSTHSTNGLFTLLPSGKRYRSMRCKTDRFRNSFFPQAIRLLNSHWHIHIYWLLYC